MSFASPWMDDIDADEAADSMNSESPILGIFNDLPENIAKKIPRPITPFQANSDELKINNRNVNFDEKFTYDIEIDLVSYGKNKMKKQREIQQSCFSPAPSFMEDNDRLAYSPYLSVF